MGTFKKAKKRNIKLRLALTGPAGSGKTYTALEIAKHIKGRTAVIDTEHGSSEAYGDIFDFDVLKLTTFSPDHYAAAIHAAEAEGYDNIIIDSLSHAWTGKEGALQLVDDFTASSKNNNKFTSGWSVVTPMQNEMIEAILGSPANMIVTMRTKTEYVLEDVNGKKVPVKKGMAPVQRDGVDYEFSLVLDLDTNNNGTISKTRALVDGLKKGKFFHNPGKQFASLLVEWMNEGDAPEEEEPETTTSKPSESKALINDNGDVNQSKEVADLSETKAEKELREFTAKKVEEGLPQMKQTKEKKLSKTEAKEIADAAKERTKKIIKQLPKDMQPPEEDTVDPEELPLEKRCERVEDFLAKNKVMGFLKKKSIFETRIEKIGSTLFDGVEESRVAKYFEWLKSRAEEFENETN